MDSVPVAVVVLRPSRFQRVGAWAVMGFAAALGAVGVSGGTPAVRTLFFAVPLVVALVSVSLLCSAVELRGQELTVVTALRRRRLHASEIVGFDGANDLMRRGRECAVAHLVDGRRVRIVGADWPDTAAALHDWLGRHRGPSQPGWWAT
jgi:hypothetical protein